MFQLNHKYSAGDVTVIDFMRQKLRSNDYPKFCNSLLELFCVCEIISESND
jgi:hypothetical protein